MKVELSPQWQEFIRRKLESGDYSSADEVLAAALLALEGQDAGDFRPGELDALLDEGERSLAEGGGRFADDVFDALKRRRHARRDEE